jgi:hypothetical protein
VLDARLACRPVRSDQLAAKQLTVTPLRGRPAIFSGGIAVKR